MDIEFWNPLHFLKRVLVKYLKETPGPASLPTNSMLEGRRLDWDSGFFKADVFRIEHITKNATAQTDWQGILKVPTQKVPWVVHCEVPSEDIHGLRRMSDWGFSLVETRLTYYHILEDLPETNRKARPAGPTDITSLRKTASGAVNAFDKYHADPFYRKEEADAYLETYIQNCVNGFAELVFVPDLAEPPASFVALSRMEDNRFSNDALLYRIPLTACLPENKGWHFHLCLSALHYAHSKGAKCLVMTTQSTNKAVIHNCEKLGFKLGSCSHIFSKSSR